MKESKLLKASWMIYAVATILGMLVSAVCIVTPLFVRGIFESYVGQSWGDFTQREPRLASLFQHLSRLESFDYFLGCVLALFIVFAAYRKGQKWAWVALVVTTVLGAAEAVVFGSIFSDPVGIAMGILTLCIGLIPLLLPVKEIWSARAAPTLADGAAR